MTPEKKEITKLVKYIKNFNLQNDHKIWYFKHYGGAFSKVGVPDFIMCYKGIFIAIEMKAPGREPTDIQRKTIQEIRNTKGFVTWFDNAHLAIDWLTTVIEVIDGH